MQCFTRPSHVPRTVHLTTYRAPPCCAYCTRIPFKPEPDVNGRRGNPDAFVFPPPHGQKYLQYHPVDGSHRMRHMKKMLCFINMVNFTTGQDAGIRPLDQRVPYTELFRHSDTMKTTTASTYVHHGIVPVKNITTREHHEPGIGIIPSVYGMVNYQKPDSCGNYKY